MSLRFDAFELDVARRQLTRNGEAIHLSPKALQLLRMLLERAPNAVSKEEIHAEIWPATFVSETNLAGLIAEIRGALGDAKFVRTVHGFGYAFTVTPAQAVSRRFRVVVQGREVALAPGANIVGRSPEAVVFVEHDSVSREHARITVNETASIEDLKSKNGTFVNGKGVTAPVELRNRVVIAVGEVNVTFLDAGGAQSTVTARR